MTGSIWHVGDSEELSCDLYLREAGVSRYFDDNDGYGKMWIWVERGSGREYLQSNLLSLSATKHEFDLTFDGTSLWDDAIDFVVPPTLAGENIYVKKVLYYTSDDSVAMSFDEEHYCTVVDLDDIDQTIADPNTSPTSDQLSFKQPP